MGDIVRGHGFVVPVFFVKKCIEVDQMESNGYAIFIGYSYRCGR